MNILESAEMYLETILILSKKKKKVRSIDIAEYMRFSKPSVSRAINNLHNADYIEVDDNGYITLNKSGFEIANEIYERHQVLSEILLKLGVSEENAIKDACKIEHDISKETFEAIKQLKKLLDNN